MAVEMQHNPLCLSVPDTGCPVQARADEREAVRRDLGVGRKVGVSTGLIQELLFFNVEKWSEKSFDDWLEKILPQVEDRKAPLIKSLGYTPADIERLIPLFDPFVNGFELSTHYIAASGSLLLETTKKARSLTKRPVFMKLSAHGGDIVANAIVCEKGGADGITAINSVARVRGRSRLKPGFVLPIITTRS